MSNLSKVEYRVREITRFAVTRYHQTPDGGAGVETKGEYDNATVAHEVAYALCKAEHERLGWSVDDERIRYPATKIDAQREFSQYSDSFWTNIVSAAPRPDELDARFDDLD